MYILNKQARPEFEKHSHYSRLAVTEVPSRLLELAGAALRDQDDGLKPPVNMFEAAEAQIFLRLDSRSNRFLSGMEELDDPLNIEEA